MYVYKTLIIFLEYSEVFWIKKPRRYRHINITITLIWAKRQVFPSEYLTDNGYFSGSRRDTLSKSKTSKGRYRHENLSFLLIAMHCYEQKRQIFAINRNKDILDVRVSWSRAHTRVLALYRFAVSYYSIVYCNIHTYIHIYIHTCINTYMYLYTQHSELIFICLHACMCIYIRICYQHELKDCSSCPCVYIHTYIHTNTWHIHTYIHTYTHTYIHTYIHTFVHTYVHTCVHTYIHTYVRTYIHR
jgi:hypothetical protein